MNVNFEAIEFKCPICQKHIKLETSAKGVHHRNWVFHISLDHEDVIMRNEEMIPFWLEFWAFYDDPEMVEYVLSETGISKQEERT